MRDRYPDRLRIEIGDERDRMAVRRVVQDAGQVFHFAGQVAVTTSLLDPLHDFEVNARGTVNLLAALQSLKDPPPLLFTSTNKVYGALPDVLLLRDSDRYVPLDADTRAHGVPEARPLDFHSPYGCSKGAADQYVLDYARTFGLPFPGEPLGCVLNVHRRSEIGAGQTVAVIGVGFLGALLVQLAAADGARVIAISRRPYALEVARQCGAAEVMQQPLELAGEITRVRGRLVIAGYHQDGLRQINLQLWNWRGLDVINAHERDARVYTEGIRLAVEALAAGRIDPEPLFTHRFELDELDDALATVRDRPEGFLKALVLL